MRKFEKISFEQFKKDVANDITLYKNYLLPERKTKNSAGYDFYLLTDITIKPNEILKIPTGVKVTMNSDEMLMIIIRSGIDKELNLDLYQDKMEELINDDKRTVLIVSHSLGTLKKLCNKVLWLHEGEIKKIGDPEEIISEYEKFMILD